jgi:hypothetical protein
VAATQRVVLAGATTWTVVSESFSVVEPVEHYLEFARQSGFKPNTIKAYARGLAQWWTYLEHTSKTWDAVQIRDFGNFLAAVRHNEFDPTIRQLRPEPSVVEATVRLRLRAVLSFHRYQAGYGNDVAPFLYDQVRGRSGKYLSFLEHAARRSPHRSLAVRVRERSIMPQHLRDAARRRHGETTERATAASSRLSAAGKAISFASVAREADVSTDFLYRQPQLR